MLAKLLDQFRPTTDASASGESVGPDISRVIKMTPAKGPAPASQIRPLSIDTDNMGDLAEQAVDDLSSQFEAWMQSDLDQLYAAWVACQTTATQPDNFRALFTAAHNIRGVASSYGYPAVSRLCGSLCNLLMSSPGTPPADLVKLHIDACRAVHRQSGKSETSQSVSDAVCEALERKVATGLPA